MALLRRVEQASIIAFFRHLLFLARPCRSTFGNHVSCHSVAMIRGIFLLSRVNFLLLIRCSSPRSTIVCNTRCGHDEKGPEWWCMMDFFDPCFAFRINSSRSGFSFLHLIHFPLLFPECLMLTHTSLPKKRIAIRIGGIQKYSYLRLWP